MKAKGRKNRKLKRLLIVIWVLFLAALGGAGFYYYKNRKEINEDLGVTKGPAYETNANPNINALVITYLHALGSCDQTILKSCVTDPSQFDDMTLIRNKAKVITGYSNINCYTMPGNTENSTVVYVVSNISIAGVSSTPLDIYVPPFYVIEQDGNYLIDNTTHSQEVSDYINSCTKNADIQKLYQKVLDDQKKCADEDPAFAEFYEKLYN